MGKRLAQIVLSERNYKEKEMLITYCLSVLKYHHAPDNIYIYNMYIVIVNKRRESQFYFV